MRMPQVTQVAGMNLAYVFFPLSHFLDAMVEFEIESVELWGGVPHLYADDVSVADVARVRREMERRDLTLACYTPEQCSYPVNLAASGDHARERSVRYFERSLEIAAELGAGLMLVTSGWGYRTEPQDEAWKRSRESLQRIALRAGDLGVDLALEALQPTESNLVIDMRSLGRMLAEIDSTRVRVCLDTVSMAVAGDSIDEFFVTFGEALSHIHLNDGRPAGHLTWGDGSLPLVDYLEQIARRDYRGHLTLEIADERYRLDPDDATRRGLAAVRRALAQSV